LETNLWSQDYDSLEFNEIPGVQTQIRNAVAKGLRLKTEAKLGSPASVQTEAYQVYLKGRYFLDRRDPASLQKALNYFQQSAARDRNFARAWASVALSYELLEYVRAISPIDAYPNALLAARRAAQIDPGPKWPVFECSFSRRVRPHASRFKDKELFQRRSFVP